jgi:hypothetical protein
MLDKRHLSGIGRVEFLVASELLINSEFGGLTLVYKVISGEDDKKNMINPEDNEAFIKEFNQIFNSGDEN